MEKSGMPLGAIAAGLVAIVTVFISLGSVLLSIGKVADRVGQNTESLNYISADLKGVPSILEGITTLQGITTTKIDDNKTMLHQINSNQNMMREEIQRNAEMKLGKDDFFRLHDDTNERLLYLERNP